MQRQEIVAENLQAGDYVEDYGTISVIEFYDNDLVVDFWNEEGDSMQTTFEFGEAVVIVEVEESN